MADLVRLLARRATLPKVCGARPFGALLSDTSRDSVRLHRYIGHSGQVT